MNQANTVDMGASENVSGSDAQKFSLYHTDANMQFTQQLMQGYLPLFASCRSILDVGCGPGLFLDLLRRQESHRTFLGLDVDADMVRRAQGKGFDARCLRAEDLPADLPPRFDGIYAGHIIEHMAGCAALRFLQACYDLLLERGVLLIRTPNWEHPYVREVNFWLDITHVRPYPPELLQKVLADIGFGVVKGFKEDVGLQDVAVIAVKTPREKVIHPGVNC